MRCDWSIILLLSCDWSLPWISHEEEDEISTLGVHEPTGQIVDHGDVASLPGPDHDHHQQEEQDLSLPHVQLTRLLIQENI